MKIISIFLLSIFFIHFSGCKTIENKSEQAMKKENEKISKFLQKPETKLKIAMGEPNKIIYNDQGSKFFVYIKKKYNITCERKFEINRDEIVIGFTSKGCF